MKKLLIALAVAAATACDTADNDKPSLPADRAPTIGELRAAPSQVTLRYDPATVNPPFWAAWRGLTTATFDGPQAGIDTLPASLSLDEGFEELDDCMSASAKGSWTLGAAGEFSLITEPETDGGSSLSLVGTVTVHYFYEGQDPTAHTDPKVGHRLIGSGTWTVTPGSACEADDFAGGTTGTWTLERPDAESIASAPVIGRRARLFALDASGRLTVVEGPLPTVLRIAGEVR